MNKFKLKKIIWTLLFASITYYITLPAINLHSFNFYIYVITIYIFYKLINIYDIINIKQKIFTTKKNKANYFKNHNPNTNNIFSNYNNKYNILPTLELQKLCQKN